jgi:hypothetical protein
VIIAQRFIAGNGCTANPKSRRDDRNSLSEKARGYGEEDTMKQVIIIVSCFFLLFANLAVAEVWMDDFEGNVLNEKWIPIQWVPWADEPWDWKVEDGILKGRWPNWNGQFLFLKDYPSLDYTMQVKCRIDNLLQLHGYGGGGFIFRASGTGVEPGERMRAV